MHVIRHTDLDAFLAAVAPMAARGEASASFFTRRGARDEAHAAAAERTGLSRDLSRRRRLRRGDAARRRPGADRRRAMPPPARRSPPTSRADWPGLQGVVGAPAGCEAFARKWQELTGRAHRLRVRMRQHTLAAVNDVPAAPGTVRMADDRRRRSG